MSNSIDISVIIPMYNAERTIIECLDSVIFELVSTAYSWEILVIDDGSLDKSLMLVTQYRDLSSFKKNVRIYTQKNQGVSSARNVGLLNAKGEYIAFNDSDDRWIPGRIPKQISLLRERADVILVSGLYKNMHFNFDGSIIQLTIKKQILKNHVSPTCAVVRRSAISKSYLFDENMECGEDVNFFNRIICKGTALLICEKFAESILEKHSWGDTGLSAQLWKMEKGELRNLTEIYRLGHTSIVLYLGALLFSLFKYFRRVILSFWRNKVLN